MALTLQGAQFEAKGGTAMLQQRYAAMQAVATRHGIQELPQGQPTNEGLFLRAIDFISRPLYAVTGVADVLMGTHEQESDKYIVSRVLRELFSGVGGLKGEKEFFGDIAEQAGIPEGAKLSDLTGPTLLSRYFDPTVRGTAAFALDILADPLTYVGVGALGRLSVVSRGGRVNLSELGEGLLTRVMDHKTAVVAKRLGKMTVNGAEGTDAFAAWEEAVGKVVKTKGKDPKALAEKARVFANIELEISDRMRQAAKAGADAQHKLVLAQNIRKSANRTVGKIISGEMDGPTARRLLEEAGLNPNATNITEELAKLTEKTKVYMHLPGTKPKTLFELSESGRVSRAVHYFTDPAKRRVIDVLESRTGTKKVLDLAREQKLPLQKTVHNLFNRDEFLASDVDGYVMHKDDLFNKIDADSADLAKDLETNFANVDNKPELVQDVVRYMDNPEGIEPGVVVAELAEKHGVSEENVARFVSWAQDRYQTWGLMDVENGVLDGTRFARFNGRYVNHEILGWSKLTDRQRNAIADLYSDFTGGQTMNVNGATIGRYAEHRHFATLPELEAFLVKVNDEIGTNLRVNFDLKSLMAHRGSATIEAAATTRFLNAVRRDFGRKQIVEQAGLLAAILPSLQGPLARKLAKELSSDQAGVLNRLISHSSTIGADNANANFFGIPYKEAEKYGLDRGVIEFLDSAPDDLVGRDTAVEFVNVVRTTEDDLGNAFQVLGSTRSTVRDDGTVKTVIRLYQDADVTTVAKELVGRRGWNLMSMEDRKTWHEFFEEQVKGKWIDPETGKPYANARDAFAQTAADVALDAWTPPSAVKDKYKPFMQLFENLRGVWQKFQARVLQLREKVRAGEISPEVKNVLERAQTARADGIDMSGLGTQIYDRFGPELYQRRALGEGINIHSYSYEPLELASVLDDSHMRAAVQHVSGELQYPKEIGQRNAKGLRSMRVEKHSEVGHNQYAISTGKAGRTRWTGAAAPRSKRVRVQLRNGEIATFGPKHATDWVEEVISRSTAAELRQWGRWYKEEAKRFMDYFGHERFASEFTAAMMANQRMTPSKAFGMSVRQHWNAAAIHTNMFAKQETFTKFAKEMRDLKAAGKDVPSVPAFRLGDATEKRLAFHPETVPGAALPGPRLRTFYEHGTLKETESKKLVDFLDSGLFKKTRTFHGDDPFAGQPAVVDVHSFGDAGYIDSERWGWLALDIGSTIAESQGKQLKDLTSKELRAIGSAEMTRMGLVRDGSITRGRYEMAADYLRQVHEYVATNRKTILSSDGVPIGDVLMDDEFGDLLEFTSTIQALGWMQKRKAQGIGASFNAPTIESNVFHLPFEVAFGDAEKSQLARQFGGRWEQLSDVGRQRFTAYFAERYTTTAMEILGVPHMPNMHVGVGAWQGKLSPNATYSAPLSPENAEMLASAIGYLGEQDAMFMVKLGPNSSSGDAAVDIIMRGEHAVRPEKISQFYRELHVRMRRLYKTEYHPFVGATGSPVRNGDGSMALRFVSSKKTLQDSATGELREDVQEIIDLVAKRHGVDYRLEAGDATSALIEGGTDGEEYLRRLESLGRRNEAELLRAAKRGLAEELEQGIEAELKRDARVKELKKPTPMGTSREVYFTDATAGLPTLNPNQGFTISGSAALPEGGPGMRVYTAKIDDGLIFRPRPGETIDVDALKQRGYVALEDFDGQVELLREVPVEQAGGLVQAQTDVRRSVEEFQRVRAEIDTADLIAGGTRRSEYVDPYQLAHTLLEKSLRHENGTLKADSVADVVLDLLPKDGELHKALSAFRPHIPKQAEFVIPWQSGMPPSWEREPHMLLKYKARGLHVQHDGLSSLFETGQRGTRTIIGLRPSHTTQDLFLGKPDTLPTGEKGYTLSLPRHGVNYGTIVHELIHSATVSRIRFLERMQNANASYSEYVKYLGKDGADAMMRAYPALRHIGKEINELVDAGLKYFRSNVDRSNPTEAAAIRRLDLIVKNTRRGNFNTEYEQITYFLTEPLVRDLAKSSTIGNRLIPRIGKVVSALTGLDEDSPLLDAFMTLSSGMERTAISDDGLRLVKLTPYETRWSKEGFQRRAIDKSMTPQRRRKLAAKEAYDADSRIIKRRELQAEAAKLDAEAQVMRIRRGEAQLKKLGLEEARQDEQHRVLKARQLKAYDEAITARHGKGLQELERLDQILQEETAAIRAQQPAFQPDLFSDGAVDPAAADAVTKKQLKILRQRITKAKNRVAAELGAGFEDVLESQARLAEYSVELAKKRYALSRLSENIVQRRAEIGELHAAAQGPRRKAAELRKEARAVSEGVKRPTVADIAEADLQALRELPQEAQAAYLYEGLNNVRTIEHLGNFLTKHEDVFMEIDADALRQAREMMKAQRTEHPFSPYGKFNRPQGWKKVTVKMANGEDEVWELPEGIADDLAKMGDRWLQQPEVRGLLRLFDFGTNTFKGGVTVLFPAFHFRNGYSNVFQSALDIAFQAFHPQRHLEALSVMVGGTDVGRRLGLPEVTIVDKFGNRYTSEHLRTLAREHQVAVDFKALQEVIESGGYEADRRGLLKALTDIGDKISKPGRAVGSTIETEARMMHFITLIRRGLEPAEAAAQVKKFLFDYNNLSDFEKQWMRRIFPFYTWNSKNLRMQIQQMVRKPGLVNNLHKGFMQERGPENDLLPEYLRGDLKVRLEPGPGKVAAFLTGIDLPTQAIDVLFSGSLEKTMRDNLGLINPLIKSPIEYAMNMENFSGKSIEGAQYQNKLGPLIDKFPQPMKEWFDLRKFPGSDGEMRYTANGTKVYLVFKSWALSRIMGTSAEFVKMIDSDEKVLNSWKLMTGMQMREYDFSEAQKNMLRARYERIEDEMIKRGLYMQYTQPYLHPEIKQRMEAAAGVESGQ